MKNFEHERVLAIVAANPGVSGLALDAHGLRARDAFLLAEMEAAELITYVKDGEMSGWYVAGSAAAKLAQEQADERWREAELARVAGESPKHRARNRYAEKVKKRRIDDGEE